jgi:hypothetical protein
MTLKYQQEIYECLTSGWTPARVSHYIERTYGTQITTADIKAYRETIPKALIIPPSYIRAKLLELDIQVDAIGDMARVLKIMEDRVGTALLQESISGSPLETTNHMIAAYWRMLEEYIVFRQRLGELPSEPIKIADVSDAKPKLGDILKKKLTDGLQSNLSTLVPMPGDISRSGDDEDEDSYSVDAAPERTTLSGKRPNRPVLPDGDGDGRE